jgi:protease IV
MKKFLIGILCGFVFAGVALVILGFALVRAGSKSPEVASESILMLRLEGAIGERAPDEIPLPFFDQASPWTVLEVEQMLEKAATDSKIKAVVFEPFRLEMGWAKAEELRSAFLEFKKCGKPIYTFLRYPGAKEYYLASATERISMVHEDILDIKGLRATRTYYKNTLDKLGVQVEIVHAGAYKDFGDSYTRTSMSDASRESMNGILDGIYSTMVQGFASGRKKTPAEVEALLDNGPHLAKAALQSKLVDALEYEDDCIQAIAKKANVSSRSRTSAREYRKVIRGDWNARSKSKTKVAYLVAEGDITRGEGAGGFGSEEGIASRSFIRKVNDLKKDDQYQAVLLRIDSGGGDAIASDELLAALKELSKAKPMVISMSDVAASGGYYMAVTGDPILAYPSTITGSIGVVYGKPNLRGLYEKIGLSHDGLQRGKNADLDADDKPLSEVAKTKLREGIDETYKTFVEVVAAGRKAKFSEIEPLAQGRAWIASDPKAKRLSDQLGGLAAAKEALRKKANFAADAKILLLPYPPPDGGFSKLFEDRDSMSLLSRLAVEKAFATPQSLTLERQIRKALRPALVQGGMLRWMPYEIDVR